MKLEQVVFNLDQVMVVYVFDIYLRHLVKENATQLVQTNKNKLEQGFLFKYTSASILNDELFL